MSLHSFNPNDQDLIDCLNKKITEEDGISETESLIKEVDLCNCEPQEIPTLATMKSNHTWHIISPVRKLNGSCQRTNRSSKTGHWKVRGKCTIIKDFVTGKAIGSKRYLDFELNETKRKKKTPSSSSASTPRDKQPGWTIHEYSSLIEDEPKKDAFVLCKLMKKATAVGEASPAVAVTEPAITPNHVVDASSAAAAVTYPPIIPTHDAEASSAAAAVTHPPMVTPNEVLNDINFVDDYGNDFFSDCGPLLGNFVLDFNTDGIWGGGSS